MKSLRKYTSAGAFRKKDLDAAPYGGARYPVEARMDARIFARFHLDVGIGDIVMKPPRTVRVRDWLDFAGIPAPEIHLIPREQQVVIGIRSRLRTDRGPLP